MLKTERSEPAITALWEQVLDDIAHGRQTRDAFLQRQEAWITNSLLTMRSVAAIQLRHLAMLQIAAYQHPNESVTNRMTDQNMAVDDLDAFAIIVYIRGYTQRLV